MPLDYSKGKIYSIRSRTSDLVYIGSTVQPLHKRLNVHVRGKRFYENGKGNYTSSFEILEQGDYYIELVEECPCDNSYQLMKREGEIQRETECVNIRVEARTKAEYYQDNRADKLEAVKKYQKENPEKIKEKSKKYYWENREMLREKNKKWLEENPEKAKESRKKTYEKYKEKILKKNKERMGRPVKCECGVTVRYDSLSKHRKTQKHIKALTN